MWRLVRIGLTPPLTDFCDIAGITGLYSPDQAAHFKRNTSDDGRAIEIMRLMNVARPGRNQAGSNKLVRRFYSLMDTHFDGTAKEKATPSRQEVADFLAQYQDGNRAVQQAYFPDRAALFSDDLSRYPPEPCYPQVSQEDMATLLAGLLYDQKLLKLVNNNAKAGDKTKS